MRVLSSSLSPNVDRDDLIVTIKTLLHPFSWKEGRSLRDVEAWFKNFLGSTYGVHFFTSGRSALLAILEAFGIGEGDEVLVQAFTCVAVPNSVLWANAKPVYVDIDDSFNIDPSDIEKKITKHSKAIIVQHTFGIPAQMDRILTLAKRNKLLVIEDCAHSLGSTYNKQKVGTLGDAAFFSFGRDKVVSSVWGGAAIINAKFQKSNDTLKKIHSSLKYPSYHWILQQLLHPIAFFFILPTYNIGLGKIMLVLLQKIRILSFPVYPEEKKGIQPKEINGKYPNALASLLINQLTKLEKLNHTRRSIAYVYKKKLLDVEQIKESHAAELIYLRFPIKVPNPTKFIHLAKKQGVLLGRWYNNVIDPAGVDFHKIGYTVGTCPNAEKLAKKIINLPTLISEHDARKIVEMIGSR